MSTPTRGEAIAATVPSNSSREPENSADATGAGDDSPSGLLQRNGLRQFVKFCIVGFSSTVVTFAVLNLCYRKIDLPLFTSLTVAFLLSCANGFFWNRRWTFKDRRGNAAHHQSMLFLAVNLVGYLLNTSIVVLIVAHFTASGGLFGDWNQVKGILYNILSGEGKQHYSPLLVNGAQAAAVGIVVWWNFFANRHWTFKH